MNGLTDDIRRAYAKYRELILYVVCGGLTTAVDFGLYWFLTRPVDVGEVPAQCAGVAAAIVFAYIVNKRWVFLDGQRGLCKIAAQFASFASMRLISGAFQVFCVWLFVEKLGLYDMAVKAVAAVVVVLANYVFSKLIIFKKRVPVSDGASDGATNKIKEIK